MKGGEVTIDRIDIVIQWRPFRRGSPEGGDRASVRTSPMSDDPPRTVHGEESVES